MDLLAAVDDFSQREDVETDHEKIELLVLTCNQEAMKYLREGNLGLSLDLLRKAEKVLSEEYMKNPNETIYKLIGVTLNNLGCYYKKTNKPKVALTYLKKALQIEAGTLQDNLNIASTHLNICAIYSSLMQHNEAIKHVKMALDLLETERNNYMLSIAAIKNNNDREQEDVDADIKYKSIITTTIMAYFNYGVELEHIKDLANCLKTLTKGFELANRELGSDHSLTENIRLTIQKLVEKKKIVDAKTQKREEYMMRVLEMNKSMAGHPEKLEEFPGKEKTRKSTSVQRSYGKPFASKPKQKSVRRSDRSMEHNSEIHNTYLAHDSNALPEIKKPPKRETKPPVRSRRQASVDNNNDGSKGRIANNNSIGLPKIPSKEATSPTSKPERTRFNLKHNPYQKKPPIHGKYERQPLETEIQNLDSQISKLQGEILQIDDGDSAKGHRSLHMQETPSQMEYDPGLDRAIYESAKVNPMEFGSRILESESSRILLNASGFENSNMDQPRQRGSRSPEDEFKYQDDVKARFLKHRYFVPKKNIPPVHLKKNLYHGEESGYRDLSMTSSKRSLENYTFTKGKKPGSNRQSIGDLGDENQGNQPYKNRADLNPGQEKIHAYMQYFD